MNTLILVLVPLFVEGLVVPDIHFDYIGQFGCVNQLRGCHRMNKWTLLLVVG